MEANKSDYIQDFSGNPVNAMFNMSKTASAASRPVNELSIDEQEQQARQQEQEILWNIFFNYKFFNNKKFKRIC